MDTVSNYPTHLCKSADTGFKPREAFIKTEVVSNRVLPGHPQSLESEVGEPGLECQVDIIEADCQLRGGGKEYGEHNQLLVAEH